MRDPKYLKRAEYRLAGPPSYKMQHQNNCWLGTCRDHRAITIPAGWSMVQKPCSRSHPDAKWRDRPLAMEKHQEVWDKIFQVKAPGKITDGLYKCLDMYDANEFTISTTLGLIASEGAFSGYTVEINQEDPYKGKERWRRYFTDGKGWQQAFKEGMKSDPLIYPQPFDLENYNTVPQPFGGNHDWYIDKDGVRKKKTANSYPNCFTVRPSLNCYMFGNYQSLGNLYSLKGDDSKAQQYAQRARDNSAEGQCRPLAQTHGQGRSLIL